MSSERLLHIIYVHGFQGNDTTFQSFPTHLQKYLAENVPRRLNLKVQSSLYPTYRSRKPISHATKNFLEWLATQPPGPVILVGHSMGGLLVAEATTDPSIVNLRPRRIVGMIAFDCPYLGMHPHVVITGIASLLPNKSEGGQTEKEMNVDPNVKIVDNKVTDDWENFKRNMDRNSSRPSLHSPQGSSLSDSLSIRSPSPLHSRSPSPSPNSFVDRTVNFLNSHADDPFVKWVRKHSDEPFNAGKTWIVEHFQFGSCMFDPSGLKNRYTRLVEWNGPWVNYWTMTLPKDPAAPTHSHEGSSSPSLENGEEFVQENNLALMGNGFADNMSIGGTSTHSSQPSFTFSTSSNVSSAGTSEGDKASLKEQEKVQKQRLKEEKRLQKQREKEAKAAAKAFAKAEKEKNKEKIGHHFVVLPTGLGAILGGGDKWEKVVIGGVNDEVAAHCGMFIPGQNLDYEGLVERVGRKVLDWCETL